MAKASFSKSWFFDKQAVIDAVGRVQAVALAKIGGYVRKTAQRLVRSSDKSSKPGSPPKSHSGKLKRYIEFAYNPSTGSVVVGPVGFSEPPIPGLLEHGGTLGKRKNKRRKQREVGDFGNIRDDNGKIVFVKLRSEAQVRRAMETEESVYGPMELPAVRIEPRPYMGPALEKTKEKIPKAWADAKARFSQ